MKTGKAMLAVMTGLAAGAALGVIFASGESDRGRDVSRMGEKVAETLGRSIEGKLDELVRKISINGKTVAESASYAQKNGGRNT